VAGLILAWWAHWLRSKPQSGRWTYGWRSFTILAANINGLLLVVAIVGISIESLRRLAMPSEIAELPVLLVAAVATLLNFATARLLVSEGGDDLNVRGAYLHMLADAAVSLAVVVGALVILATGWLWIDAAISIGICLVLSIGTWSLLRESTSMLLQAAPLALDVADIKSSLESHPEVAEVLDLHVWSASTTEVLLTAQLRCPELSWENYQELLDRLHLSLRRDFSIAHATLEITRELDSQGISRADCPLERHVD
jgi:cobalt-zinc-cadmium efflux system protein